MTEDPETITVRLAYEQAVKERDRLREARAFFARQLGPLPAFAGISAGIVAAFSDKIHHRAWMWIALGFLAALVVVSLLYSGMPAYRQLRYHKETEWRKELGEKFAGEVDPPTEDWLRFEDGLPPKEWYRAQLRLERELYGEPAGKKNRLLAPGWKLEEADLQDQLDRERTGVFLGQALFLAVIACLFAARL